MACQALHLLTLLGCLVSTWFGHSLGNSHVVDMAVNASTADNRVILTSGNSDSILTHLPLMLTSMRLADSSGKAEALSHHLIVVTYDSHALHSCRKLHRWCVLDQEPLSSNVKQDEVVDGGQARLFSAGFLAMTWRKMELVLQLLDAGLSVYALDLDIVVFRNFLDEGVLPVAKHDIVIEHETRGDNNFCNVGFFFIRSKPATKAFMTEVIDWRIEKNYTWEQAAFNDVLNGQGQELEITRSIIPDDEGADYCMLYGVSCRTLAELQQIVHHLTENGSWGDSLTFFHLACWMVDFEYNKAQAMQTVLQTVLQVKDNRTHHRHVSSGQSRWPGMLAVRKWLG